MLLVLALILAAGSMFTVAEDEYACTVRFSKIIDTTSEAGLHFKLPFVDSVKYFTDATQLYDIPPSEVLTSDKQNMTVDCYILWRISDPKLFYQTLGSTAKAEERLDAITYSALKTDMGTLAQADIINMNDGAERNTIYDDITVKVDAAAKSYGIHVEDVKIKRFDLPESNLNAVYGRMISERNQMAEKYTADGNYDASIIRNDVDKQVNIIVSDARGCCRQAGGRGRAGVHAPAGGGLRHAGQEGLLRVLSGAGRSEGQPERRRKDRHSGRQFRACQDSYGRKIEIS